ncbi:MAG: response regulator transcription factor [Nitrococcus sp.]|nr:response regulator transcription factor [Nitrococcus sp.]
MWPRQGLMARARNTLLLVDDDPVFCRVLAQALTRRGFQVDVAQSAAQALAAAMRRTPEHAIVDLRLGEDSGLALMQRLLALHGAMRIVVLTGYASIATAVEAVKLGAVHYLAKPADADEIFAALERQEANAEITPSMNPPSIKRLEWEHLQRVLQAHDGNISASARALRMHRRTLQRKLGKCPVKE